MVEKRKYKYVVLTLLCLGGLSACYCQYQLAPMAGQIIEKYHMNQMQYATVFSASMVPAIFFSLIAGVIVDRVGAKRVIFIGMLLASVGLLLRIFTKNYIELYLCMLMPGIPATLLNASNAKIFGAWFSVRQTSMAVGIYLASCAFGMALGTGTTAMLPSIRTAFIVAAVFSSISTILWGIFMKEDSFHPKCAKVESSGADVQNIDSTTVTCRAVFRNRDICLGSISIMCTFGNYMVLSTYLPTILQGKSMTAVEAGMCASLVSIGYVIGCIGTPILAGKLGQVRKVIFFFSLAGTILTVLVLKLPSSFLLICGLLLLGFCIGGILPLFMSFPVRIQQIGRECAGTAGGVISTFELLGAVIIPSIIQFN